MPSVSFLNRSQKKKIHRWGEDQRSAIERWWWNCVGWRWCRPFTMVFRVETSLKQVTFIQRVSPLPSRKRDQISSGCRVKNKLSPSLAFHREKKGEARGEGNKNERRKIRERRHSRPFHPLARVPPFYFAVAGWKRWMARAREKKRSLAKRGRGGRGGWLRI